ncbi:hypothetical protein J7394_19015 [Ruegeria sp. R13_0]|uniref:hypothetical protein n=1 Tax=Ruegeria sp. R13_0 TaxID=2821099 RepID=UPI001ADBDCCD|nr:hypothetical protein [Ruegeria sp. R13_0]MBO9436317.1 hypothetical protein [Ruegeria sp. R13_0]
MTRKYSIGMLWVEGPLSYLEQLCIKSFLDNDQAVRLYVYEDVSRVPDGVEVRDANEVLPTTEFVTHTRTGSVAPHADKFRYRMLQQEPNLIWADTDAYCRLPFETETGHFYGWQEENEINNGVLRLPPDSPTLKDLIAYTEDPYTIVPWLPRHHKRRLRAAQAAGTPLHAGEMPWGVWGPRALTWLLHKHGEERHALPRHVLYPISFQRRRRMARPNRDTSEFILEDTASIHFYGRRMRDFLAIEYDGIAPEKSLIGQLLIKHDIDPGAAPIAKKKPQPSPDANTAGESSDS